MKGTSVLLRYLVNQYLVDCAKTSDLFTDSTNKRYLSALKDKMSVHDIRNVDVIEYWDETEYFNISTDTDGTSLNGSSINDRYWEEPQDTGTFSKKELEDFYLNSVGLNDNDIISDRQTMDDFMYTVFNLGANTSNIDKEAGIFSAKLADGQYSIEKYPILVELRRNKEKFDEFLSAGDYEYPEDDISNQISNVMYDYISGYLSAQYLCEVSVNYDKYRSGVDELSSRIDLLVQDYETFLNDQYNFYYIKSNQKYCYEGLDT